ncbi:MULTISPECIES: hypothetical protein [unclassified Pseudomonas]|nr:MULTISPECIES: hypothetical protein [unclassified Pseudomonas]MDG9922134.1 hypothetical protein [Pseudomonas sp. GD04045]MDH0033773.1 hypothetical protein [Pseudomonas sp. GD04019]
MDEQSVIHPTCFFAPDIAAADELLQRQVLTPLLPAGMLPSLG